MNGETKAGRRPKTVLSRRNFSILLGSGVSMLAFGNTATGMKNPSAMPLAEEEVLHSCEAIHQTVWFKASRKQVYEALTDEKQFDKVVKASAAMQSGMSLGSEPTRIAREIAGTFTLFGGHIVGRHLELVREERIVQAWRVATWEAGVYSIARFVLAEEGVGTKLTFDHTGFPNGQGEHLAEGWRGNYWEPMEKVLR